MTGKLKRSMEQWNAVLRTCLRVYHLKDDVREACLGQMFVPTWPADYELVAFVDTDDLDTAYLVTQNVDAELIDDVDAEAFGTIRRSTMMGDVIVRPDGRPYVCAFSGWVPLVPQ